MNKVTGIMVLGTASDVGKSFVTAALCRLFVNEGIAVAPFKSQNMTRNIVQLDDGTYIGKSQNLQARAAKIKPTAWMNPILLQPHAGKVSVSLLGAPIDTMAGNEFRAAYYERGITAVESSLHILAEHYELLVLEGAGSPVELNLKERELVNMKVAEMADVPVLLVADIDRGGVFASIVGTLALLTEAERARVKGIVINKFRGDPQLFTEGVKIIEEKTNIPVLGVIPALEKQMSDIDSYERIANHVKDNIDWPQLKEIIFQWKKQ